MREVKYKSKYDPPDHVVNKLLAMLGHRTEEQKIVERLRIYGLAIHSPRGYYWVRSTDRKRMFAATAYFIPAYCHEKMESEVFRDEPEFIGEISRNTSLYEITTKLRFSSFYKNQLAMHCKVFSNRRKELTDEACQTSAFSTVVTLVSYSKSTKSINGVLGVKYRLHYKQRRTIIDRDLVSRLSNESNHLRSKVDNWAIGSGFSS